MSERAYVREVGLRDGLQSAVQDVRRALLESQEKIRS